MTGLRTFDILDPAFKADPYSRYARLREDEPAARVVLPDGREAWLLTRYADVSAVLMDRDRFSTRSFLGQIDEGPELPPHVRGVYMLFNEIMLGKDPPEHTRLRKLVQKAFTARLVEGLRPNVQRLADRLLDAVEERAAATGERTMDVIADYAFPIPVTIIMDLLGVPEERRADIRRWSTALAAFDGSLELAERIAPEVDMFIDYLRELTAQKRRDPADDLISALVHVEEDGDRLSEDDLLAMVYVLIFAGHETTLHLIGNGTLALLTHPGQPELLRRDPGLLRGAVEELLRFDPSVEVPRARVALADVELAGVTIRRGDVVLVSIASANRDPRAIPGGDTLDVTRAGFHHLTFGKGIHVCVGAPLARVEGQVAFETLLRRMPDLALAVDPAELTYRPGGIFLRGLAALPVTF
ncbi:cytochrome P450 family protein [Nucisporomicrobium flavum]|uniref:cytochrome P450 family protein n=1 Tax=Nucisporomicrobium flavum TaxID=2785915 RepID=UPI003C2CFB5A